MIACRDVSFSYPASGPVDGECLTEGALKHITCTIEDGSFVLLCGASGCGKTTLTRLLNGLIPHYHEGTFTGSVYLGGKDTRDLSLFEISQMVGSVFQNPRSQFFNVDTTSELAFGPENHGLPEKAVRERVRLVAEQLRLESLLDRSIFSLSGGEKTRVNLARLILEDTDILLLDEPTNHLDLRATEWLEEYLDRYKGTVLAISHDRWFLDRVVRRVIEIHDGKAEFYAGNYSFYVEEKERRYEEKLKQYEKEQAKLEQLQEAVDKLHLWAFMGNDKLHKRAFSIEKRMERIRTTDKPTKERRLDIKFGESEFRGDEVLTIKELKKSFDGRTLFDHVNLEVIGGERIALLGDNGTGKSTLLKILLGEEEPDSGKLRMGPTVKVGYLPQIIRFSHPERNLVDTMIYDQDCSTQTARNRLAAFNFRGEDVFKPVSALSGGEQSRLRLCMLMDEKINLLILDEPTNHLDVASREWIEEAVESYEGNLLFVSHDRYFINRFATRIWMLENGQIIDFRGTFEEYRAAQERKRLQAAVLVKAEPEKPKKEKPRRPGGTKELEKQVAAAERAVAKAEERQYELTLKAEEVASNYLELQKVYDEQKALEEEIAALYTKWETLAAELEEARG